MTNNNTNLNEIQLLTIHNATWSDEGIEQPEGSNLRIARENLLNTPGYRHEPHKAASKVEQKLSDKISAFLGHERSGQGFNMHRLLASTGRVIFAKIEERSAQELANLPFHLTMAPLDPQPRHYNIEVNHPEIPKSLEYITLTQQLMDNYLCTPPNKDTINALISQLQVHDFENKEVRHTFFYYLKNHSTLRRLLTKEPEQLIKFLILCARSDIGMGLIHSWYDSLKKSYLFENTIEFKNFLKHLTQPVIFTKKITIEGKGTGFIREIISSSNRIKTTTLEKIFEYIFSNTTLKCKLFNSRESYALKAEILNQMRANSDSEIDYTDLVNLIQKETLDLIAEEFTKI